MATLTTIIAQTVRNYLSLYVVERVRSSTIVLDDSQPSLNDIHTRVYQSQVSQRNTELARTNTQLCIQPEKTHSRLLPILNRPLSGINLRNATQVEKETLRFLLDSVGILSYFHALYEYLSEKSKVANSRTHRSLNKNPPNLGVSR